MAEPAQIIRFPAKPKQPCIDPSSKGLVPLYEEGMRCPGCRLSSWHIGRLMAECGRCGTALDLPASSGRG